MTTDEAREMLLVQPVGSELDVSLRAGVLISRKDLIRVDEGTWNIFHSISGDVSYFSLEGAVGVLVGERSAWDGDLGDDDDSIDWED